VSRSLPDRPGRSGRPSRFTIRELLVLVALVGDERDRRAYLQQAFIWYHERTRALRAAILVIVAAVIGGSITLANLVHGAKAHLPWWLVAGVVGGLLVVLLTCGYVAVGRTMLSPFHREYLCCLALLGRLESYAGPLGTAVRLGSQRVPSRHVVWWQYLRDSVLPPRGAQLLKELRQAEEDFGLERRLAATLVDPCCRQDLVVGEYLFDVLGPVPTDDYERRFDVQREVDRFLCEPELILKRIRRS